MTNLEKHWALKSSNLKRVKNNEKKSLINRKITRNSIPNIFDNSTSFQSNTDLRKSSYSVLPNPSYFNKTNHIEKSNEDLDTIPDHEREVAFRKSNGQQSAFNSNIDNFVYKHLTSNGLNQRNIQNGSPYDNSQKARDVKRQHKQVIQINSNNRIDLNVLHAIQLVFLEIIDEALEDEIVPDVLIDVLKEMKHKDKLFRQYADPIVRTTAEQIMMEVIDQNIQETVLINVLRDSKSQLKSEIVFKSILDDTIRSVLIDISKDLVRDFANEKLMLVRATNIYENLVVDFISEDIKRFEINFYKDAIMELILEENIINPIVEQIITNISIDIFNYYDEKVSRINLKQINEIATKKPMGSMILDHLISVGVRQKINYGPSFVGQYCFEHIVMDILLGKSHEIYDQLMNTIDNNFLRRSHLNINQSIATKLLLKELVEHSNNDLCDLDADEVKEFYIPRFVSIDKNFFPKSK